MKKNFKTNFDLLLGEEHVPKKEKQDSQEVRTTFIIKNHLLDQVKAIAYWDRKLLKEIIDEALSLYIKNYEEKNGEIQLPKVKK